MESPREPRANIISVINTPLGFFALSLLIVEGFLGITLIFSKMGEEGKFAGMLLGAYLFLVVVLLVWALVWFQPKNITYGEHGHLETQKMQKNYGTSDNPVMKPKTEASTPTSSPLPARKLLSAAPRYRSATQLPSKGPSRE